MKKIIFLCLCFFSQACYSVSKLPYGIENNMVEVVIKNNTPCFYLKDNNRKIKSIIVGQYDKFNIWMFYAGNGSIDGNKIENCVIFGDEHIKFKYDEPYRIFVQDDFSKSFTQDSYRLDICIIKHKDRYEIEGVDYINKAKGIMNCKNERDHQLKVIDSFKNN